MLRKKTVRCTVFADVGKPRKWRDRRIAQENTFKRAKKKASTLSVLFSMKIAFWRVKSPCDEIRFRV